MTARAHAVHVEAPEELMLRSAAALRRMGARLTRYDLEAQTLEARASGWAREVVIRLTVRQEAAGRCRLTIDSWLERGLDLGSSRRTIRRFEAVLADTPLPALERRR
ncbi:MAG: hypothetical protein K6T92_01365 [Candidatus Rokubacteria bacterium]|nr:hypothetical protein [Candidatus Rokubacteria bacterium]